MSVPTPYPHLVTGHKANHKNNLDNLIIMKIMQTYLNCICCLAWIKGIPAGTYEHIFINVQYCYRNFKQL